MLCFVLPRAGRRGSASAFVTPRRATRPAQEGQSTFASPTHRGSPRSSHPGGFDEANISTFQSPTNFARIAYRTNSAVDETPSLRIAEAR
jgi:hypothetical protein